jgi:hypothetical protein
MSLALTLLYTAKFSKQTKVNVRVKVLFFMSVCNLYWFLYEWKCARMFQSVSFCVIVNTSVSGPDSAEAEPYPVKWCGAGTTNMIWFQLSNTDQRFHWPLYNVDIGVHDTAVPRTAVSLTPLYQYDSAVPRDLEFEMLWLPWKGKSKHN